MSRSIAKPDDDVLGPGTPANRTAWWLGNLVQGKKLGLRAVATARSSPGIEGWRYSSSIARERQDRLEDAAWGPRKIMIGADSVMQIKARTSERGKNRIRSRLDRAEYGAHAAGVVGQEIYVSLERCRGLGNRYGDRFGKTVTLAQLQVIRDRLDGYLHRSKYLWRYRFYDWNKTGCPQRQFNGFAGVVQYDLRWCCIRFSRWYGSHKMNRAAGLRMSIACSLHNPEIGSDLLSQ